MCLCLHVVYHLVVCDADVLMFFFGCVWCVVYHVGVCGVVCVLFMAVACV